MSAAPNLQFTTHAATREPQWSMLVEVTEAARLLKVTERHLRRRCAEELAGRALAFKLSPPTGGRERWFVDRRLDGRLAPGRAAMQPQGPSLSQYSEAQRQTAYARAACVKAFREAREQRAGRMSDWLPELIRELRGRYPDLKISQRSLYHWDQAYKGPSHLEKLIDKRGGRREPTGSDEAWTFFEQMYLDQRRPTLRDCWRQTQLWAKEHGHAWCTERACRDQVDKRIPPERQEFHRNPRKWRRQHQPYIEQDPEKWQAGECWEGDHRQFNFWLLYDGRPVRPWLTAWMDKRSHRLAGYALSVSPNSSTILAALRHGLQDELNFGGPDVVWIDNGKDYDAEALQGTTKPQRKRVKLKPNAELEHTEGLFALMDIEPHFGQPYNPNSKPQVERFFETLEDFDKSFLSYCGRKPEDKPEYLNELLRPENWHKLPRWEHFAQRFEPRVAWYNATRGLERGSEHFHKLLDGMSPDQYLAEHCPRRRVLPAPEVLDLCMQHHHRPVRVGRNGVAVTIGGQRLRYGAMDPALIPLKPGNGRKGELVRVSHDPRDVSRVRIYDLKWRFITEARANDISGRDTTEEQVRQMNRDKNAYKRHLRGVREGSRFGYEYLTAGELIMADRSDKQRPVKPNPDVPLKPVQTPLDAAAKDVRADTLRKAAGAEHDEPPTRSTLPAMDRIRRTGPPVQDEAESGGNRSLASLRPDDPPPNPDQEGAAAGLARIAGSERRDDQEGGGS